MAVVTTDRPILSGAPDPEELGFEQTLRPQTLAEYVGQTKVVDKLRVFMEAARGRNEALDHVLLFGPPGLGKTSLAHIVAREMGTTIRTTSGPVLERPAIWLPFSPTWSPGRCSLSTRSIDSGRRWRRFSTPRWRTFSSIWSSVKGPAARTMKIELRPFHPGGSHHPGRSHYRAPDERASASSTASTSTSPASWRRSSPLGRLARDRGRRGRRPGDRPA